jgi:hypothetical protein
MRRERDRCACYNFSSLEQPTAMELEVLEKRIKAVAPPGTNIPKPQARAPFRVKGGFRRGQRALIDTIPNHSSPARPHERGITYAELEQAYAQLQQTGRLTTTWFQEHLSRCYAEGSCNFTTVGGLFAPSRRRSTRVQAYT